MWQTSGPEGRLSAVATVLISEREETFEATLKEEAMLVAAFAQADRVESVPVSQVMELLRKR